MADLAEFLLARIGEDEEAAREAALTVGWEGFGDQRIRSGQHWVPSYHVVKRVRDEGPADRREVAACAPLFGMDTAAHIARWDPARVLAECAAKRAVVDHHARVDWDDGELGCAVCGIDILPPGDGVQVREAAGWPCPTLRWLASPYADHLEFEEAWGV